MARAVPVTHNMIKFTGMKGFTWRDIAPISVMFLVALWVLDWTKQYQRDHAPVSEYFEVRQLAVPDHKLGTNPVLAYDRFIHKSFSGDWRGKIMRIVDLQAVCSNRGTWQYTPDAKRPEEGFTLDWFMDKQCNLKSGTYMLESCWDVHREQARTVSFCLRTAPFNVFDPVELSQ